MSQHTGLRMVQRNNELAVRSLEVHAPLRDPSLTPRSRSGTLPALTGLRFLAASHVVFFHYAAKTAGWNDLPDSLKTAISSGPTSVLLFFTLSGFILAYNYLGPSGALLDSLRHFWVARFARVYPMYLFAWLIYVPIGLFKYSGWTITVASLSSITLLQSWLPGSWPIKWNSPAWSLSVEALLYLLFPWIAAFIFRVAMSTAVTLGVLAWVTTIVFAISIHDWVFFPPLFIPSLVVGIVAARIFLSGLRMPSQCVWIWLALIVIGLVTKPLKPFLGFGMLTPLYALLIFSLAQGQQTFVGYVLGARMFTILGDASYSLYLLHGPIWDYALPAYNWLTVRSISNECRHPILFFLYLGLAVFTSIACLRLIEIPWRERIKRTSRP